MTSNDLVYPPDIHRDCSPCPLEDRDGGRCDLIGTGIHQSPDVHLMEVHGYSQDKVNGIMLGAKATGYDEMTTLYRVHQFILLFAPAKPAESKFEARETWGAHMSDEDFEAEWKRRHAHDA